MSRLHAPVNRLYKFKVVKATLNKSRDLWLIFHLPCHCLSLPAHPQPQHQWCHDKNNDCNSSSNSGGSSSRSGLRHDTSQYTVQELGQARASKNGLALDPSPSGSGQLKWPWASRVRPRSVGNVKGWPWGSVGFGDFFKGFLIIGLILYQMVYCIERKWSCQYC